jgi:aspartate aminotransferase
MKLSERIKQVSPSKTLAITQKARDMKQSGINVIGFSVGEPDFDTPKLIRDAAKNAIDEGHTRYTPVAGTLELRKAISNYILGNCGVKYEPNQIIATCGAKAALYLAFQVLTNPGDEVIIPTPYWVSYPEQVKLAGATPVLVETSEENNFKIRPQDIEKAATNKTRLIIINSPSNPTGSVYSKNELKDLVECCISKNIVLIADEIYDKLTFDNEFCSILEAHPEAANHTIYINGVSKSYAMTGWRMGYAAGPAEVIAAMTKYQGQLYSHITAFVGEAVIHALQAPSTIVNEMKNKFKERRDLTLELAKEISGMKCTVPEGAFYIFPNIRSYFGKNYGSKTINTSEDLATYLLEEAHVAVVPGTAFGVEGYIRISYALSDKDIKEGMTRITKALNKL